MPERFHEKGVDPHWLWRSRASRHLTLVAPVIQERRPRRRESTPPLRISSDMTSGEAGWIPVVRQVIKHVHLLRVVCYPVGNCEWWTMAIDYSVYLVPYPILNRVRFAPWTTNKLSDIA